MDICIIKMCPHLHVHKNKTLKFITNPKFTILQGFSILRAFSKPHSQPSTTWTIAELVRCVKSMTAERKVTGLIKGDFTRDDSQRRFLAQHSVAMLEKRCNYSKQCRNNVATLCCAKNRRRDSSRVTSP